MGHVMFVYVYTVMRLVVLQAEPVPRAVVVLIASMKSNNET